MKPSQVPPHFAGRELRDAAPRIRLAFPPMQEQSPDFSITDVFSDAFASFRQRIGTHIGFNALFIVTLFASLCLFGCVFGMLLGFSGAAARPSSDPSNMLGAMGVGVLLLYAVLFVIMFAAMCVHHGFTLAITVKDLRGEQADLGTGMSAVFSRLLSHVGLLFAKMGIDWIVGCVLFGLVFAVGGGSGMFQNVNPADPTSFIRAFSTIMIYIVLVYFVWIVWVIAVRGFIGLAAGAVQVEELGPIDAIGRSVSLLAGRRLQFIGMRFLWGVTWIFGYLVLYVPMALVIFANASGGEPNPFLTLLLFPYMIFFYFAMFLMYSFDSVLEGAYFARCVPKHTQTHVAEVFG